MNQKITLYHGSEQIIESPTFGFGKQNNDFGLGFYCTESEELAKEWAVSSLRNGFVNRYSLDTEYLKILNLNNPDYTILNWIAVLVAHRLFSIKSPAAQRAKRYLMTCCTPTTATGRAAPSGSTSWRTSSISTGGTRPSAETVSLTASKARSTSGRW